jgi:hypothetical protein
VEEVSVHEKLVCVWLKTKVRETSRKFSISQHFELFFALSSFFWFQKISIYNQTEGYNFHFQTLVLIDLKILEMQEVMESLVLVVAVNWVQMEV